MSPVEVRRRPDPAATPARAAGPLGVGVIGAVLVLLAGVSISRQPTFVERITVVNPTGHELAVEARGAGDDGWTLIGWVEDNTSTALHEVLDQGDEWTFRFSAQGRRAGELTQSRAEMEGRQWRVPVPARFETELTQAGVPSSR